MNLELSDAARRDIKRIQDKNAKVAIIKALDDFCENPQSLPLRKLEGYEKLWRISLDNWRLILLIEWSEDHAIVVCVADRKEVYKIVRRRK